jgi:hypothetical protein
VSTPILLTIVAVVAAAVIWKVASRGLGDAKYVIRVTGEGESGVVLEGEVPGKSEALVAEFVAGLELPKGAKIWGVPDRDRLTLRFSSQVPDHLQQRIRNFFYN